MTEQTKLGLQYELYWLMSDLGFPEEFSLTVAFQGALYRPGLPTGMEEAPQSAAA